MSRSAKGFASWALVAAATIVVGQAAIAAIPGPDEVIYACFSNRTGALRVVDQESGAACKASESQLHWNQEGPTGPQGPAGSTISLDSARVYSGLDQSIPADTNTPISFESERWDTGGLHDVSENASRLVAQQAGLYEISGSVVWTIGSGARYLLLMLNGGTILAAQQSSGTEVAMHGTASTVFQLSAGDYVELHVFSDTPGQSVLAAGNYSPELTVTRLGS